MPASEPLPPGLSPLLDRLDAESGFAFEQLLDQLRSHPALGDATPSEAVRAAGHLRTSRGPEDLVAAAELAMKAHNVGEEGAGLVFAECADQLALMSGRPQPFGTVATQQHGDLVLASVDVGVTDDQRAEFGLPALDVLRRRIDEENRRLARDRCDSPGLSVANPFVRIWRDPDPAALRARWEAEGTPCWADGEELTIVAEGPTPFAATPVFPIPSWPAGDGIQVLSLRVDRLSEAVITYTRTPLGSGASLTGTRGSHDGRFRGPDAPAELASNDPLTGSLFDHALESESLGEPRRITVYRPAERHGGDLPVVFATDGNLFAPYARRLDAAIEAGTCPPVVVVAAHSATFTAQANLRALEYLPGFDDRRFDAHQRFFVTELARWADATLPISTERSRRAVFGCSDGGGHALATGMLHPGRFGHVLGFSTGMPPDGRTRWPDDPPFVHLCAGTLEGPFHQATLMWSFFLERLGAPHHLTERVCGHDLIQWCEELPFALTRAFG